MEARHFTNKYLHGCHDSRFRQLLLVHQTLTKGRLKTRAGHLPLPWPKVWTRPKVWTQKRGQNLSNMAVFDTYILGLDGFLDVSSYFSSCTWVLVHMESSVLDFSSRQALVMALPPSLAAPPKLRNRLVFNLWNYPAEVTLPSGQRGWVLCIVTTTMKDVSLGYGLEPPSGLLSSVWHLLTFEKAEKIQAC